MGKIPESSATTARPVQQAKIAAAPKKKLNCFVMPDKPQKAGLVLVSTSKTQDGCFVLGWQSQSSTWLVSEGTQWYAYASKMLKVNLAFSAIFAFCLLVVLFLNRRGR